VGAIRSVDQYHFKFLDYTHKYIGVPIVLRLFACAHDEIILEAPKENADQASKVLRDSMVESGAFYLKTVPVEVNLHLDESWAGK